MKNKKRLLIFGTVFCLYILGTFNASGQTDWTFVGSSVEAVDFYIDANTKKTGNGNILVWEKQFLPDGTFYVVLLEMNCSEKTKQTVQGNYYDPRGSVIGKLTNNNPVRYISPQTMEEAVFNTVCEGRTDSAASSAGESKSFAQIIVRNVNLMSGSRSNSKIIRKVALGEKLVLVSEEPIGVWYIVYDPKTEFEGWLNGNHFKIVKAVKPAKTAPKSRKGKRRQ